MTIIKFLSYILIGFFCMHVVLFLFFYFAPLKIDISSIATLKVSKLYEILGQPTYEIPEKGIIAWEECSKMICKIIEIRVSFDESIENQHPQSIKIKNICNNETRFFEKFKILNNSKISEYITIWPYGTFCVSCKA